MRFQKLLPNNLAGVLNEKSNFSLVEYVDISRSLPNYRLPAKLLFKPKRKKFCFEAFATSTIWLVKTIYFNWLYISFYFFSKSFVVVFYGVIFVSWFNIRFILLYSQWSSWLEIVWLVKCLTWPVMPSIMGHSFFHCFTLMPVARSIGTQICHHFSRNYICT